MIYLKDIIDLLGPEVISMKGDMGNVSIKYLKPAEEVDKYTLDWINQSKNNKQIIAEESRAKVIITDNEVAYTETIQKQHKILIYVKNPKLAVAIIGEHYFLNKNAPRIFPNAIIDPEAEIGESVFIGSNTSIGKCKIGNNVQIFPNVAIYDKIEIGNGVTIQSGAIIGTDGLGCERKEDGTLIKFPHFGGVQIFNNVEIGANCIISRGVFTNTIIGEGTKINALCFIAHNCIIGRNVWITGNAMLAGSVVVGDNVTIFSKAVIREHRKIGDNAIIGMGAVVTKDIPAGETWIGNPAKKYLKKGK